MSCLRAQGWAAVYERSPKRGFNGVLAKALWHPMTVDTEATRKAPRPNAFRWPHVLGRRMTPGINKWQAAESHRWSAEDFGPCTSRPVSSVFWNVHCDITKVQSARDSDSYQPHHTNGNKETARK